MASDEQFSLCWNNFHANMSAGFHGLLSRGDLVDVTLAADGRLLQAHKLVLSVCSPYFQEMFKSNPNPHPIVFLKDVSHSALRDLLQFMYQGEVNVKQEELASFISTAEQLQVKGLTGNQNEESSTPSKPKPTSRPGPRSSQQRQSVMTKLETDLDSKPSSTPVAVKRPNRPSIASNNSSSSQSGPAKRKCVDPLEAGPSGSAKEEFVTIPDEDENNAVAPKMEPEFVNESMWDDDDDGANNEETNFGEDDSNMEMTGFDGSTTGDGNITGGGEGGAVGDAQDCTAETAWSGSLTLSNYGSVSIINCCIKIPNNKNASQLNLSQWPKKLRMFTTNRLSFEKMVFQVPRIDATTVVFVIEDASLPQLSKCLTEDKVGFVMIPSSTSSLSHNILILRNSKLRHQLRGIIPKDQVKIVNVVREFLKKEICQYFHTSVS
ncbi:protein tramtrack, beta isoform-like isoform X2 [Trichoplusia ni]|uniref:Protein tramtrack, beta isoform-like isoform X2 n=1 Tax=Trichoplusia ni TaxID=7111 RepID=A0A7E5X2Y8_TRINI|nr:protein tramtrack, beta isoform-like isoform X2 [Trichoplusia ni]